MSKHQSCCFWLLLCSLPVLTIQECQGKQETHTQAAPFTEKQPHTTQEKSSSKQEKNKPHKQEQAEETEKEEKGKKKEKKKKGKMNRAVQVTTVTAMTLSAAASAKKIAEDE